VCYCAALKRVCVVIIFIMYAPLTVDSSPSLHGYVLDRSVYVRVIVYKALLPRYSKLILVPK
jgi:hypothetical protein